ncbi:hypothetical protein KDD93_00360 [Campylobacter sp. faydin G-24]|uniref:Uncharacterized protein n=1 Tax=Campylobacter anatolicus TaxID=2829105 RepID=A0ABS5HFI2_9BACT|nr:hypothetical protein [Campylobacter anatolicus]MBR8463028.1 hypothetical protein [Campylobacter anatolicus]
MNKFIIISFMCVMAFGASSTNNYKVGGKNDGLIDMHGRNSQNYGGFSNNFNNKKSDTFMPKDSKKSEQNLTNLNK